MSDLKYNDISRGQLISDMRLIGFSFDDNRLSWEELCELTEFDGLPTMLAFGLTWNDEGEDANQLDKISMAKLRMAHYNATHYPKKGKP